MWSSEVTNMIITGIWETLYMTLVSTLVGYVIKDYINSTYDGAVIPFEE
jgi:ABC-type methionine transport system permease subunit